MNKDLISVVLPVYNTGKYLEECINSILSQTYTNFELIIVNDGSTDNSELITQKFLNDKRVRYYKQENKGLSEARNKGIELSKGKYITFIDSDDVVSKYYIEQLYKYLKLHNADFSICNFKQIYTDDIVTDINCVYNTPYVELFENKPIEYLNFKTFMVQKIISCGKLFRKSLFSNIKFEKNRIHEDEFIIHKLVLASKTIIFFDLKLYFYRINPKSITHQCLDNKQYYDGFYARYDRIQCLLKFGLSKSDFLISKCLKSMRKFMSAISFREKLTYKYLKLIRFYYMLKFQLTSNVLKKALYGILIALPILDVFRYFQNFSKHLYNIKYSIYKFLHIKIVKNDIAYIGSITHSNLGDQAISIASRKFLMDTKKKVFEIPEDKLDKNIIKYLTLSHIKIALRGGGNIGNDWLNEEEFQRFVIKSFPNNKIIYFPESIHFTNDADGYYQASKSQKIYSKHTNLTIACREKHSFAISKNLFKENTSLLCPDIVFYLKNKTNKNINNSSKRACFIRRKDVEKLCSNDKHFQDIKDYLDNKEYKIENLSTLSNYKFITMFTRKRVVNNFLKQLNNFDLVVTDRLHAMIFCYLIGKPCVVLNNSTNKISGSIEWLKDDKRILFYKDMKLFKCFVNNVSKYPDVCLSSKVFDPLKRQMSS